MLKGIFGYAAVSLHEAATPLRVTKLTDSEDLHRDVVWAAAAFCHFDEGVTDFGGGLSRDCGLDLAFGEQPPQAVGTKHEYVARFKRNGLWRSVGSDAVARSQCSSEDMTLGVSLGLFGTKDTVLDQAAYVRVILGQARDVGATNQVQAAVTYVGKIEQMVEQGHCRTSRPLSLIHI